MVLRFLYFILFVSLVSCNSNSTETTDEPKKPLSKAEAKYLFQNNCASCHGIDGALGVGGAFDLSKSKLTEEEVKTVIQNGRNGMPSFEGIILPGDQQDKLVSIVKSLRK